MAPPLRLTQALALSLLQRAAAHEIGVRFHYTTDLGLQAILNFFYEVRKSSGDPALETISISPIEGNEIFIYRRTVELEDGSRIPQGASYAPTKRRAAEESDDESLS